LENRKSKSNNIILDSFALLAYFGDEKGRNYIETLLKDGLRKKCFLYTTVINLGEVMYIIERERGLPEAQLVLSKIKELPIEIVVVGENLTLGAAHIKANYSIAYADCIAASLTLAKNAIIVTGDPEFKKIEEVVNIYWL
jgi:ribonuclease VapC